MKDFQDHKKYGVLAQLGARHIRIVEATGSNPVYSMETAKVVGLFRFLPPNKKETEHIGLVGSPICSVSFFCSH